MNDIATLLIMFFVFGFAFLEIAIIMSVCNGYECSAGDMEK